MLDGMMSRPLHRRLIGLATALATLGAAVAVPLLDTTGPATSPVAEAHHEPGQCSVHHHHLACVQHHASAAHPGPSTPAVPAVPLAAPGLSGTDDPLPSRTSDPLHLPRAPPLQLSG